MKFCVAKNIRDKQNVFGISVEEYFYEWKNISERVGMENHCNSLLEMLQDEEALNRIKEVATQIEQVAKSLEGVPVANIIMLPPIQKTPKNIICVGKNYKDHAIEMGGEEAVPEDIIVFSKATTTMIGHNQQIPLHKEVTNQLDYEGELAVVIGKNGKNIKKENAFDYIFGYTIVNDITARDLQSKHKQFFIGKSLDGSCPIGPYIVTKDEIGEVGNLQIKTYVNSELRQNSNTGDMIFPIEDIIEIVSKGMTLEAGDIIATGTPAGVGKAMKPQRFLQSGDKIEIEIEGIGCLKNSVE